METTNDERGIMEELCNIAKNMPVFAGKLISHQTAQACLDRKWAMRYEGEYVLTELGKNIIGAFEIRSSGIFYKPKGCKQTDGNYKNGCGHCGTGDDKKCRLS